MSACACLSLFSRLVPRVISRLVIWWSGIIIATRQAGRQKRQRSVFACRQTPTEGKQAERDPAVNKAALSLSLSELRQRFILFSLSLALCARCIFQKATPRQTRRHCCKTIKSVYIVYYTYTSPSLENICPRVVVFVGLFVLALKIIWWIRHHSWRGRKAYVYLMSSYIQCQNLVGWKGMADVAQQLWQRRRWRQVDAIASALYYNTQVCVVVSLSSSSSLPIHTTHIYIWIYTFMTPNVP